MSINSFGQSHEKKNRNLKLNAQHVTMSEDQPIGKKQTFLYYVHTLLFLGYERVSLIFISNMFFLIVKYIIDWMVVQYFLAELQPDFSVIAENNQVHNRKHLSNAL